jgi:hypothetical protein
MTNARTATIETTIVATTPVSSLSIQKVTPADTLYPPTVKYHRGEYAPDFWYI